MCLINKNSISVIVPVYKAEKLLSDCIESVIAQTFTNWFLILVDDGSPDNSGAICDEYVRKDSRISVIHQKNGGPGSARNAGINSCKTCWLTFIDADDKILPTYLENFHVEKCVTNTTLSCQGFKRVDLQGNFLNEDFDFTNSTYEGDGFLENAFIENNLYNYGQSVGKLYNKAVCDKFNIRMNQDIRWSEDHLFYLHYLMHVNKIITNSGCLYLYQLDTGQETLTHRPLPYKEAIEIFHNIYQAADALIKQYNLRDSAVIQRINYHSVTAGFSIVIQNLYREEKNRKERQSVLKILKKDMKHMHQRYNPNGVKGKMLKYALLYLPISLLDLLLS